MLYTTSMDRGLMYPLGKFKFVFTVDTKASWELMFRVYISYYAFRFNVVACVFTCYRRVFSERIKSFFTKTWAFWMYSSSCHDFNLHVKIVNIVGGGVFWKWQDIVNIVDGGLFCQDETIFGKAKKPQWVCHLSYWWIILWHHNKKLWLNIRWSFVLISPLTFTCFFRYYYSSTLGYYLLLWSFFRAMLLCSIREMVN